MSPCAPLYEGEKQVGYVCTSHNELLKTGETVTRWCFACRKHHPHVWEVWGDPGPSYYEPFWVCRCSGCGKDKTQFGDGA